VGGRTLQDDAKTLREAGVSVTSRLLVTRGAGAATEMAGGAAAEERAARMERVKRAAEALAGRCVYHIVRQCDSATVHGLF
jgi:hypothetical protein